MLLAAFAMRRIPMLLLLHCLVHCSGYVILTHPTRTAAAAAARQLQQRTLLAARHDARLPGAGSVAAADPPCGPRLAAGVCVCVW
jgi:hypothetical protein